MLEIFLFFIGAAAGVAGVALRMRHPGESWLQTIARPFGAGGPGPRK
jgi:hypothetical protein